MHPRPPLQICKGLLNFGTELFSEELSYDRAIPDRPRHNAVDLPKCCLHLQEVCRSKTSSERLSYQISSEAIPILKDAPTGAEASLRS